MTDKLERELKKALERVDPPLGFAERVLARAANEEESNAPPRAWFGWFPAGGLRWAMTGTLCAALAASGIAYRQERERRGQRAKEQLMLALRITSSKLQIATESMQEMNSRLVHQP
ncbi:MAG TPA: hypothetical protein VEJ67_12755 [Candidatus Cybelea sp.]|nr:hypothetical protein [Candidatus Cybelea sp.]